MITGELLAAERTKLLQYARLLTRSAEDAEDLWQETQLRAWRKRSLFDGTNLGGWLSTIMYRINVTAHLRRKSVELLPIDTNEMGEGLNGLSIGNGGAALVDATRAFMKLTWLERKMLSLYTIDGLSYKLIGAQVGLSEPIVKKRIFRAREKLEEFL